MGQRLFEFIRRAFFFLIFLFVDRIYLDEVLFVVFQIVRFFFKIIKLIIISFWIILFSIKYYEILKIDRDEL